MYWYYKLEVKTRQLIKMKRLLKKSPALKNWMTQPKSLVPEIE